MAQELPSSIWETMAAAQQAPMTPMTPVNFKQAQQQLPIDPNVEQEINEAAAAMEPEMPQRAPAGANYQSQFDDMYMDQVALRNEQLQQLKDKLAQQEAAKPTGIGAVNLKPLAALADSLTGSRTAHNYDSTTPAEKQQKELEKLQAAIAKEQGGLSDDQLGYLKLKAQEQSAASSQAKADAQMSKAERMQEFRLREKWDSDPITKNSKAIAEGYQKIMGTGGNDASDLSLIYGLMRLQDPGSVVRESEADMAAKIGGFPAQTQALMAQLQGTGKLTAEQRESIKREAQGLYKSQLERQALVDQEYQRMAADYGYNPRNVVLDVFKQTGGSSEAKSSTAGGKTPQVGEVRKGYKFNGGNPSDPNSWSKVN